MKTLSEELETIKDTISKASSEIIELNEDKTMIRRKQPLPESQESLSKSVYVKGLPSTSTLDELHEFFATYSTSIQAIRFRRDIKTKTFKGSIFVEFATEEEAKRFSLLEVTFQNTVLVIKTKMAYFEEKNSEKTGKISAKAMSLLERMGSGRLVKIQNFPATGITHENLKESLKDTFAIGYVDFSYETGSAWIRFREAVAAAFVEEFSNGTKTLEIGEFKLDSFVLPNEEEQAKYYEASARPTRGKFDNKRGGRSFGGNKKRTVSRNDEPSESKRSKQQDGEL